MLFYIFLKNIFFYKLLTVFFLSQSRHYMIKYVSDLRQVSGFLRVLWFPPPMKHCYDITEILLKVALNTINLTKPNSRDDITVC